MKKANLLSKGILLSILATSQIILSGCSDDIIDDEKKPEEQIFEIQKLKVLSRKQISVVYKPTLNPNIYSAVLKWPAFDGIVKLKNKENLYIEDDLNIENEFTIKNLIGGSEYIFFSEISNSSRQQKSEVEINLLPPKDLVLSGNLSFSKNQKLVYERVFISDEAKIYTNEFQVDIEFNELIVGNRVEIFNFNPDLKSEINSVGKDGGVLSMRGPAAKGFLNVYLNGQAGSDGDTGFLRCQSEYDQQWCLGTNGSNAGARGRFLIELEESIPDQFDFEYKFLDTKFGQAGVTNRIPNNKIYNECNWYRTHPREPKVCNLVEPMNGKPTDGGSVCFKYNKDTNYECIEKN